MDHFIVENIFYHKLLLLFDIQVALFEQPLEIIPILSAQDKRDIQFQNTKYHQFYIKPCVVGTH